MSQGNTHKLVQWLVWLAIFLFVCCAVYAYWQYGLHAPTQKQAHDLTEVERQQAVDSFVPTEGGPVSADEAARIEAVQSFTPTQSAPAPSQTESEHAVQNFTPTP